LSIWELDTGSNQGDEPVLPAGSVMWRIDASPTLFSGQHQLEGHRQTGFARAGTLGHLGAGFDGGERRFDWIGRP
jgi:hypothetical protein